MNAESKYTKKDFVPDGPVKWCAGCGDFAILAQTQKVLAETGRSPDEFAFISGIGCSSRFPYYVNTYGYHGIHGRALSIATGVKVANPDLSVWVAMGDGDGLAIGGNHFLHTVKRNIDMVSILMDNQIYGLTKGQFSPTSLRGQKVKTAPTGKLEDPMDPVALTMGIGGTFVARSIDRNPKHMAEMIRKAYEHKGFSMVQILQNCPIFNDGAYDRLTGEDKADNILYMTHGEKLIFGKDNEKCIVKEGFSPKVALVSEVDEKDIIVHDERCADPGYAHFLSLIEGEGFPVPMGVFRQLDKPTYDGAYLEHEQMEIDRKGAGDLQALLDSGDTWEV